MAKEAVHRKSAIRLDFAGLRRQLSSLGIEASYRPAGGKIQGLEPQSLFCQCLSRTNRHCQRFLSELARDHAGEQKVRSRSCLPGAFTVAKCLEAPEAESPVVLGCVLSTSLGASEELLRVAGQLQLDHQALLASAQIEARYNSEQIGLLAEVMGNIIAEHQVRQEKQKGEVESLSRNLAETYEELNFIYKLNNAMHVTANPEEYFRQIAEDLRELLAVGAVLVVLSPESLGPGKKDDTIIYMGNLEQPSEEIVRKIYPEVLAKGGRLARAASGSCPTYSSTGGELGQTLLAPIVRSDKQLGMVLVLEPEDGRKFDNIDATRLSSFANSAAVFVENFRLYGSMRQLFLGSMRALTSSIDAKDPYTCGHSERVALISKKLVELMGLPPAEIDRIHLCGLLHDIGKIGVPEAVLRKPGKLTSYEFEVIKQHPVIGAKIIRGIQEMEDLVPAVLHHHERFDGGGYPSGMSGEQIPFRARVLCIADCLDAMTSDRPYRKALPAKLAETEIFRAAGTQFDPALVEPVVRLNFPEYISELRAHKTGGVPEDIFEPTGSLLSESPKL